MGGARTYTCAACGGTFESEWSEEEAVKEFSDHFGRRPAADDPRVCDVCYEQIIEFNERR